ncbi:hypothetical protein U0070_025566, partial [Myodes glareolus]
MDVYNLNTVTQFILRELSDLPEVCYPLFMAFITVYQITLLGNRVILMTTVTERKLQTPISQHFLCWVALTLYFLVALTGTEVFLLVVMTYVWYMAICFPLCYSLIMTKGLCVQLLLGTWVAGFLKYFLHTKSNFSLFFCKSNQVNQYYCGIPPVVALCCSSSYMPEMLVLVVEVFLMVRPPASQRQGILRCGRGCHASPPDVTGVFGAYGLSEEHLGKDLPNALVQAVTQVDLELVKKAEDRSLDQVKLHYCE